MDNLKNKPSISKLKKRLLIAASALCVFVVLIIILAQSYINSSSFHSYVENKIASELNKDVQLGSLDFKIFSGLELVDLIITEKGTTDPFLLLPSATINFTPLGLLGMRIENLEIDSPKVFISLGGGGEAGSKTEEEKLEDTKRALPVVLSRARINNAEITFMHPDGLTVIVGPLDLSLDMTGRATAKVEISSKLPSIDSKVQVSSTINMKELLLESGNIDIGDIDLANIGETGLALPGAIKLQGTVGSKISIMTGKSGSVGLEYIGTLKNIGIQETGDAVIATKGSVSGEIKVLVSIPANFSSATVTVKANALSPSVINEENTQGEELHELTAAARYDMNMDSVAIDEFLFTSTSLGSASLKGKLQQVSSGRPGVDLSINISEVNVGALRATVPSLGSLTSSMSVDGMLSAGLKLKAEHSKPSSKEPYSITCNASLDLSGGSFSTPEGTVMAEGLGLRIKNDFVFSLPKNRLKFTSEVKTTGFEFLAGSFYGDFSSNPVSFSVEGEYSLDSDLLKLKKAELNLSKLSRVTASALIANVSTAPGIDGDLNFDIDSLTRAYNFFIRETFSEAVPILNTVTPEGSLSIKVKAKGTAADLALKGVIKLTETGVKQDEDKFAVRGVNFSLPFDLTYPAASTKTNSPEYGSLSIKEFAYGKVKINDFSIYPALSNNTLSFKESISIPLLGGQIEIKDLIYKDLLSDDRELT
ncbi:MAG: hypothetical protein V3T30_01655, partial [Thermodesulfobacteriota bacterium]